jgi:hypothetical protein
LVTSRDCRFHFWDFYSYIEGLALVQVRVCASDKSISTQFHRHVNDPPPHATRSVLLITIPRDMLLTNDQIEEIRFHEHMLDASIWDANAVKPSVRVSVLPSALAHVNIKPSLAWLLLSQNLNIVSNRRGSIPPQKRSRSPFSDYH